MAISEPSMKYGICKYVIWVSRTPFHDGIHSKKESASFHSKGIRRLESDATGRTTGRTKDIRKLPFEMWLRRT